MTSRSPISPLLRGWQADYAWYTLSVAVTPKPGNALGTVKLTGSTHRGKVNTLYLAQTMLDVALQEEDDHLAALYGTLKAWQNDLRRSARLP